MENDERKTEDQEPGERDEMEDLDVSEQQAEDVRGGRRGQRGGARKKRGL